MATLAPHSSQPFVNPSLSPAPENIARSGSDPRLSNVSLDPDSIPLTERGIRRSGSPTPSEKEELKQLDGFIKKLFRKESWKDKNFRVTVVVVVVLIVIAILLSVFHQDIIDALAPASEWVRNAPGGFLIPIAILIILSIPPLFGAEIVHILCGMIYGAGIGFLIVCVGTVLGEALTFYMFRYCLRSRAEKLEQGKGGFQWAALARVIRQGGFWVALVIRFTAIPTHIGTALFAVCGMNFFTFLTTLVLSLPRQFAGVYIGELAAESAEGQTSKTDKTITTVVIVVTIVITIIAMKWIDRRMRPAALEIIRERRAQESMVMETKPFEMSTGTLYDPAAAAESGMLSGHGKSDDSGNPNVYFGERMLNPAVPAVPSGAMLPTVPAPVQAQST